MRGTKAKRIHAFMREAGPSVKWRQARAMWERIANHQPAAPTPTKRRRKPAAKVYDDRPQGFVHTVRQFYGHLAAHCEGHRRNRGRGPVAQRLNAEAKQRFELALKMGVERMRKKALKAEGMFGSFFKPRTV